MAITKRTEEQAEIAFGVVEQLKNLLFQQGVLFVEIGRQLKIIRDDKLYEYLGDGGYDNFKMFLANGDIGIKQSTAYAYIKIYEMYVEKFGYTHEQLAEVPWYKLHILATRVKPDTKEDADEWVEKAKTLGAGDFSTEVGEYIGNKDQEEHIPYPIIRRCKDCGGWKVETDHPCKC